MTRSHPLIQTNTKKMKKIFTLISIITFIGIIPFISNAQDTIVQWTFPSEAAEADGGAIGANLLQIIETAGGTSEIQFKNGVTSKAAQATGWDNGADEKKWKVEFETTGYTNIKLSSIITSGGTDPGPRDFKVQYRIEDGEWTDVENSEFQTANDWTTGAMVELPIPDVCDDQALIRIRWIMTSDTATNGLIVLESGKSKIDNIYFTGDLINGEEEMTLANLVKTYPNPASDFLVVQSESTVQIELYNISGQQVISTQSVIHERIDISNLNSGIYMLKIENLNDKSIVLRKIMIQ